MRQYLARRLLMAVPTLLLVSVVIFVILRVLPGDVLAVMFGEGEAVVMIDKDSRARLMADLHLDKPLYVQYAYWMRDIGTGRLGTSFWRGDSIRDLIARRGPISAEIGGLSFILAWIIGLPAGILSATRRGSAPDYVTRVLTILFVATPQFWIASMLVTVLVLYFNWFPPLTYTPLWKHPLGNLQQLILPAIVLSLGQAAMIARMSRSSLLEVLQEDYIRTARAKGLVERLVMWRHAIRNALIPVVTLAGVTLGFVLGGSVAVERAFNVPGLGLALVNAVNDRDFAVIQNLVLLYAVIFVLINLLVDFTYAWLDPRIRYN